jgi:hypothetical protein
MLRIAPQTRLRLSEKSRPAVTPESLDAGF